jgi:cytochrome P450
VPTQTIETPATTKTPNGQIAPGPRGLPVLGNLLELQRKDPFRILVDNWRTYGDVVRFKMGPIVQHLVVQPEHVKHILVNNKANYWKGIGMTKLKLMLGQGLFTSEGELWQRQRRLMQPPFTAKGVTQFADDMTAEAEAMLTRWHPSGEDVQRMAAGMTGAADAMMGRWQPGATIDVSAEMLRLALNVICKTMLGINVEAYAVDTAQAFTYALEFIVGRTVTILDTPLFVPTPGNRRFNAAIRTLDALIYRIIAERRARADGPTDLLTTLIHAKDEETGQGMSQQQLRDEVMTIFFAGHETTALSLTWLWVLLSQHPEVEARLHAELDALLGGRAPTLADVPHLKYTRKVIDEALRLYPPAAIFVRDAIHDDAIGGYHIPARSMMVLSPYLTQRHPEFWEKPEAFEPERFDPERAEKRHHYAYFPFGGGQRTCIGNHFTLLENTLVVAAVAQRYRLRLAPGQSVEPKFLGTLRPAQHVHMVLHRR